MKRIKFILAFVFIGVGLLAQVSARSQLLMNYNAQLFGRSIDGLALVQLTNNYQEDKVATIVIRVNEVTEGVVLTVMVPQIVLRRGVSSISRTEFAKSKLTFSRTPFGERLAQSGRFQDGDYEFCYEVEVADPKSQVVTDNVEQCFPAIIQQMTPLMLIDPAPEDIICNTRPSLTWQPPMPIDIQTRYRVILCEKKGDQTDIEAITYNVPIINVASIPSSKLFYPGSSPELRKGQEYVWQVTAYMGNTILTKSEIWTFTVKCEEEKPDPGTESYRELSEDPGGVYIAKRYLRFGFTNPYSEGDLNFSIVATSDNARELTKIPRLKMVTGLNRYSIDLSENRAFKDGQEYMLTVRLASGRLLKLRFIYKESEL